jgi:hypothetical protein
LSEELEDFEGIFDDSSHQTDLDTSFSTIDENPLKDDASSQSKPTSRRSRHRRQRSEIVSTVNYREMVMSSNERRRSRNHALCAKDFDEKILKHLFPPDFSTEAFRY